MFTRRARSTYIARVFVCVLDRPAFDLISADGCLSHIRRKIRVSFRRHMRVILIHTYLSTIEHSSRFDDRVNVLDVGPTYSEELESVAHGDV